MESLAYKNVRSITCGAHHTAACVIRAWVHDQEAKTCMACKLRFTQLRRKVSFSKEIFDFLCVSDFLGSNSLKNNVCIFDFVLICLHAVFCYISFLQFLKIVFNISRLCSYRCHNTSFQTNVAELHGR